MLSISQNVPEKQPPVLSYKYALRVSPTQIQQMSKQELQTLCLEQAFLLWLIISIVRNPLAAIATRILAIEVLISCVEKNIRGNMQSITERSRVYISGDGGIAKRLGIHANTVSKCLKNLERYQLLKREYVYDEAKEREYLDITLLPQSLNQPGRLQDKTARKIAEAGKKTPSAENPVSSSTQDLSCPSCSSPEVIVTCRECGTSGNLVDFTPPGKVARIIEDAVTETTTALLNKIYVDTNNTPQSDEITEGVGERSPRLTQSKVLSSVASVRIVEGSLVQEGQPMDTSSPSPTPGKQLALWLRRRIGHGKIIYATGSPDTSKKYLAKPKDYQPDYKAYLLGDKEHIYGSYLLREDGTTYVLAFDFDTKEEALHDQHEQLLQTLAQAGASPVYWLRQNKRGHLEVYFDSPVDPEAALAWCIRVCPALAGVEEVYPTGEKRNNPISWPLYQRKGRDMYPCKAKAVLATNPNVVVSPASTPTQLAALVSQAITPASLISPLPREDTPQQNVSPVQAATPKSPALSESDIARLVIAEYNRMTTWDEIIALCGGANRDGKFNAVWRGENSNSVKVDADGQYACDYGRTAGYPKKLDKYEIYCLVNGGREFKKNDLAARCKAYREREEKPMTQTPEPQQRFQARQQPAIVPQQPLRVVASDETPEEIVARLRTDVAKTEGYVTTPKGYGKIWQVWTNRIGVVLDGEERVTFFTELSDMRQIRAYNRETGIIF